jgi:hypothetical protein
MHHVSRFSEQSKHLLSSGRGEEKAVGGGPQTVDRESVPRIACAIFGDNAPMAEETPHPATLKAVTSDVWRVASRQPLPYLGPLVVPLTLPRFVYRRVGIGA